MNCPKCSSTKEMCRMGLQTHKLEDALIKNVTLEGCDGYKCRACNYFAPDSLATEDEKKRLYIMIAGSILEQPFWLTATERLFLCDVAGLKSLEIGYLMQLGFDTEIGSATSALKALRGGRYYVNTGEQLDIMFETLFRFKVLQK